jgi:hypothetical protein
VSRPFDPELVLSLPLVANLATMSPEGPRNAPVWFLWEDGALWIPGGAGGSSVGRLEKDPRCAVEIVRYENREGVLAHLGIRGRGTVGPMEADRFRRLLAKYLGPDEGAWNPWFVENVARVEDPEGRLIRVEPESRFTNNVSFFRTGPELAWPERGG